MNARRAITTVGINPLRGFEPYHARFARTFGDEDSPTPEAACAFVKRWSDRWPPGSPSHAEVHYAFKVHALRHLAQLGFEQLLWLDVSCYATDSIEPLWQHIRREGHYLAGDPPLVPETGFVPDPEQSFDRLGAWSSDKSLATFNISRDDAWKVNLLSGTCIGLDLTHERSRVFLQRLTSYAVPGHYNGTHSSGLLGRPAETEGKSVSDDPRVQGHRSDEVYMTLIARELKMTSSGDYFTGGNAERPSTCIKSGYNL